MANISITNHCNLQCEYCFADKMIEQEKYYIKKEELESIISFISNDNNANRIGIIGGEPTLHPEFDNMLSTLQTISRKNNIKFTIFTNGILLGKYAKYICDDINCLINVNHPNIIGLDNYNKIKSSILDIKKYGYIENAYVGINIYPDLQDYNYIFDMANLVCKEYIRVGVCAPSGKYINMNQDEYYESIKDIFINFAIEATQLGFKLYTDCNKIPECYFNESDKKSEINYILMEDFVCKPVIDIFPNMTATSCFGRYNPIDLKLFNTFSDLNRYFYDTQYNNINVLDKCMCCEIYKFNTCQGGCLTFANERYK